MRKLVLNFLLLLIVANVCGCKNQGYEKENQSLAIRTYLEGQLHFEYYADSTIKEAYEVTDRGFAYGRAIKFSPDGKIRRLYFINSNGDTVGDDSRFQSGSLFEYYFRLNSEDILFYAKLSESGEVINTKGRPFFLSGQSEIRIGDTLRFYIATPIIPGFRTLVTFEQLDNPRSKVSYFNDIRQYNYNIVMEDTGRCQFSLKIELQDSLGQTVLSEYDTTEVFVKSKS